ncbi:hypothetical protein N7532_008411 [Penicillium argentinense]|uniref:Restriction endonuclease type IV Mrr domain-containing protein n=1 Tax=Penicillium argentinense TaxID=1131581 RepID=A0A9W9EXB9_9EURO|nr:uncharacterized protein N7532_008411 [Penicillium argentinense]KAJ5089727.1 hypothetical protein N7532_008411 [Penicillium argentinense]
MRHLLPRNGLAARCLWAPPIYPINPFRRSFTNSRAHYDLSPFTCRLYKLPSAPSPPSQNHNSLATFLSYADRISLPTTSTVYIGTHYEYTVLESLRRYALALHRVGGRDDAGIDLVGTWHLPERERERAVRVLVQCKALKAKLGPNLVRELEGALRQAPVGWRTSQTAGVLVSPREATKGVRDALARSSYPLFWMLVERDGTLRQALWNARAEELGLDPLGVETRYRTAASELGSITTETTLTWDGYDIPDMDQVESELARHEQQWVASWGLDIPESEKDRLLDTVEKIFPQGHPDPAADGKVPKEHRERIMQALASVDRP